MLAAFGMIALALQANEADVDPVLAYVASSLSCLALPVALRHPVVATVVQCLATAALDVMASGPAPFPAVTICVLVAHVALVALRHDWRIAVGVWWTIAGVSVLLVALAVEDRHSEVAETLAVVVLGLASLIALIGGIASRYRLRIRGELAAARQDARVEHERRTLVEERTRIARELHDVVAHSMSVIHMQATSAPYRLADVDASTRAEFTAIAAGARGALGEMRQLLGVLRESGAAPETDPAPGLARLPELVEGTSRYGAPVTLVVEPEVGQVPDVVGTTAYRIVQEALSNVVRHARGASATVHVDREGTDLVVTVSNTAGGTGSVEPAGGTQRSRHGITGMRERVAHLGGELRHGPRPDGGYRIMARLPLPASDGGDGRDGGDGAGTDTDSGTEGERGR
ncbi:hypothetical protein GCM10010413_25260 [Promicromonospora sukumoe]